jgi:hypothetical protein
MQKPEQGDQVILNGKLGILGDTEQPIDPNPSPVTPPASPYFDSDNNPVGDDDKIQSSSHLRSLLSGSTETELSELTFLVKAAETSPHKNGEVTLVKSKLLEMAARNRR